MSRLYRTKEQARFYWHDVLERWQQSGLSVSRFCREHRVSESGLYSWRKKLSTVTPAAAVSPMTDASFIQVDLPPSPQNSMTLELATGHRLQIANQVNEKALAKVLRALHKAKLC